MAMETLKGSQCGNLLSDLTEAVKQIETQVLADNEKVAIGFICIVLCYVV